MKALFYTFMAMFWYGLLAGIMGAALISFGMALFVLRCAKRMQAEQAKWLNSPLSAKQPPDTQALLDKAGSECLAHTFHP